MSTENEPAYSLVIDGDGVSIRKNISEEMLRRILRILLTQETDK
jgi:hypothetical protein